MPYELSIAIRYLVARRRQAFVSLISFVSALGVTVGVTALVVALALTTGLQTEMRDRMLGSMPHVYVAKFADGGVADVAAERTKMLAMPHVLGAAPVVIQRTNSCCRDPAPSAVRSDIQDEGGSSRRSHPGRRSGSSPSA